jgi:surfactin synthase thioesterase subunit
MPKIAFFNPKKGSHCENETSLSIENLTEDMVSFYEDVVQHRATVIIGHSMGGALAVHVSHRTPAIGLVGCF